MWIALYSPDRSVIFGKRINREWFVNFFIKELENGNYHTGLVQLERC